MSRAWLLNTAHLLFSLDEIKMRRQVKPFVTEYRGNARRSKDLHSSGDLQSDALAPRSRSYAEAEKVFQSEAPDDAYEAAMRAADALFDASSRKPEPAPPAAAANVFEERRVTPASPPIRMPPDEIARDVFAEPGAGTTAGETGDRDAATSPRRILQAIEPPPEDRFAALEAERAPRRRGRKPGSKNKPKIVLGDDWGVPRPAAAAVPALPVAAPVVRVPALEPTTLFAEPEFDEIVDAVEVVDDEQPLPQPRGRNDKFGWKRAGLRPGERWKRRLPKAAR